MPSNPSLKPSVLTSSSIRDLADLFHEVKRISGISLFDLFLLRDTDVQNIKQSGIQLITPPDGQTDLTNPPELTQLLADGGNLDPITGWLIDQCRRERVKIAALATYFPDVTSLSEAQRDRAIQALINCVRVALTLKRKKIMDQAIVEIVCGTILDPECAACKKTDPETGMPVDRVFISERDTKLKLLFRSLDRIVMGVKAGKEQNRIRFALAAELEPGETYVLNDLPAIHSFMGYLRSDKYKALRPHVGLNMDIAHMRIAQIPAEELEQYRSSFVHAHIADHPGMHSRDEIVGTWTAIERSRGGYIPYLRILAERMRERRTREMPPFSGAFALELEGCNRIRWIHNSLNAMKRLAEVAS